MLVELLDHGSGRLHFERLEKDGPVTAEDALVVARADGCPHPRLALAKASSPEANIRENEEVDFFWGYIKEQAGRIGNVSLLTDIHLGTERTPAETQFEAESVPFAYRLLRLRRGLARAVAYDVCCKLNHWYRDRAIPGDPKHNGDVMTDLLSRLERTLPNVKSVEAIDRAIDFPHGAFSRPLVIDRPGSLRKNIFEKADDAPLHAISSFDVFWNPDYLERIINGASDYIEYHKTPWSSPSDLDEEIRSFGDVELELVAEACWRTAGNRFEQELNQIAWAACREYGRRKHRDSTKLASLIGRIRLSEISKTQPK